MNSLEFDPARLEENGVEFAPPSNFLALPPEYSEPNNSRAWLLPVGYEATTSYGGGTKHGPRALIQASSQVELYDREFDREAALDYGIATLPPLSPRLSSQAEAIADIARAVAYCANQTKPDGFLFGVLGGEHSLSVGVAQGLAQVWGDSWREVVVVQIDAHADLRDSYEGSPLSHACAMRRVLETGCAHLVQVGIRSVDRAERAFMQTHSEKVTTHFAEDIHRDGQKSCLQAIASAVQDRLVYLTIDIDGLDSSLMPSTGTPEPGGLGWYDTLDILGTVCKSARRVFAFDCVELAPIAGLHAPDFLAAKLVYKVISRSLL